MSEVPQAPPRRARLELLVRRQDAADGFDVREIGSGVAFIQSRPQRVPEGSYELAEVASRVDGQRSFILKNTATDRFLLVSEPVSWRRCTGIASKARQIAPMIGIRNSGAFARNETRRGARHNKNAGSMSPFG